MEDEDDKFNNLEYLKTQIPVGLYCNPEAMEIFQEFHHRAEKKALEKKLAEKITINVVDADK